MFRIQGISKLERDIRGDVPAVYPDEWGFHGILSTSTTL